MRRTINISFPDDLYIYIQERADDGTYASTSEYIRALSATTAFRARAKPKAPGKAILSAAGPTMFGLDQGSPKVEGREFTMTTVRSSR